MTKKTTSKGEFEYEFGGPVGTLVTTLILPVLVLLLLYWSDVGRVDVSNLVDFDVLKASVQNRDWRGFWATLCSSTITRSSHHDSSSSWTLALFLKCTGSLIAWFLFQVLLERCLPCEIVKGAPVKGNADLRLSYRINGHLAFWVTWLVVQIGWPQLMVQTNDNVLLQFGAFPLHLLYEYTVELALCTMVLSFGLSTWLYLGSFRSNRILADGGNSGCACYDFFMGRELNPRISISNKNKNTNNDSSSSCCAFDWKVFCELRPGLLGWMLLNASCLQRQYELLGYVTGSMMLINLFQGIYVWDALFQERAILTTMDVTTDGLGFMLVFGDLAWVPFTYHIQARYLVKHDKHLSAIALAGILALYLCGYAIFRGANGQKDAFRRNPMDPELSHLAYLQTKRGTKLLTSGWWGMARKINYTGDWIMGLSWCLVCGFDSIVPYYYAIYFAILLVHRSIRDDHQCRIKYGDDWETYKKMVPYRFIPGVV